MFIEQKQKNKYWIIRIREALLKEFSVLLFPYQPIKSLAHLTLFIKWSELKHRLLELKWTFNLLQSSYFKIKKIKNQKRGRKKPARKTLLGLVRAKSSVIKMAGLAHPLSKKNDKNVRCQNIVKAKHLL